MKARNYLIPIFIIGCLSLLAACEDDVDNPVTGPPVETLPANTAYQPAFSGQTRIGSVETETPIEVTVLTSALNAPWGITSLPDGRLLITEKAGELHIVSTSGEIGDALDGIPAVDASGQGGLLGVASIHNLLPTG